MLRRLGTSVLQGTTFSAGRFAPPTYFMVAGMSAREFMTTWPRQTTSGSLSSVGEYGSDSLSSWRRRSTSGSTPGPLAGPKVPLDGRRTPWLGDRTLESTLLMSKSLARGDCCFVSTVSGGLLPRELSVSSLPFLALDSRGAGANVVVSSDGML
ncbi:hypothetical protein VUR80DRAFT_9243 [Thermomyces stellatus]